MLVALATALEPNMVNSIEEQYKRVVRVRGRAEGSCSSRRQKRREKRRMRTTDKTHTQHRRKRKRRKQLTYVSLSPLTFSSFLA